MKAMILAAGLGTRLRPLTGKISKPMVPLAGRPCMEYAVRLLQKHGVRDVLVNLHYLPDPIRNHFGDGSKFGVNLTYSYEKELLGTAGGFKKMEDFFAGESALIISGDALTDIDIGKFFSFHRRLGGIASLALKHVTDPSQYGVVLREGEKITSFQEKPSPGEELSNLANTGIYIFEQQIFDHIPAKTFYDFGKQVFPELLAKDEKLFGYEMDGYWCDIGDPSVYREAHYDLLAGAVDAGLPGKRLDGDILMGEHVTVHPTAKLSGPVLLGDNCIIDKGARVSGPAVIGSGSKVGSGALVERSILWDNVTISSDAEVIDSIIGGGDIPAGAVLQQEVIGHSSEYEKD